MPVLSSKSRDFLGSGGPEKGASPSLLEIASEVAQFLGVPSTPPLEVMSPPEKRASTRHPLQRGSGRDSWIQSVMDKVPFDSGLTH